MIGNHACWLVLPSKEICFYSQQENTKQKNQSVLFIISSLLGAVSLLALGSWSTFFKKLCFFAEMGGGQSPWVLREKTDSLEQSRAAEGTSLKGGWDVTVRRATYLSPYSQNVDESTSLMGIHPL